MNILLEPFAYDFFVRALILGALMGVVCATIGIFVVMRREALMSHALANTSFFGVTLGMLFGFHIHWSMFLVTLLSAVIISYLQHFRAMPEDSLLEFIAQVTFALAIVAISFLSGYRVDLYQYLFGDILGVSNLDLMIFLPILLLLLVAFVFLRRDFLKMTLSRELSESTKTPSFLLNTIFLMIVATVVAIGMKVIGIILISAFLVLPANTARLLAKNFSQMQWYALCVGVLGSTVGLFFSYYLNIPSGASIVLVMSSMLIGAFLYKQLFSMVIKK